MHYLTKNSEFTKGKGRQERLSTALYSFVPSQFPPALLVSTPPGLSPRMQKLQYHGAGSLPLEWLLAGEGGPVDQIYKFLVN